MERERAYKREEKRQREEQEKDQREEKQAGRAIELLSSGVGVVLNREPTAEETEAVSQATNGGADDPIECDGQCSVTYSCS